MVESLRSLIFVSNFFENFVENFLDFFEVFVGFFVSPFVQFFLSRHCDLFGLKIVEIRAILAIFRPFEVFAGVRDLFGCFEIDPGRKELEIYSVRDLYDSTMGCSSACPTGQQMEHELVFHVDVRSDFQ